MKVKQIIALVIVVALLMTGSVLVTMAYLTNTQTVTNTFTVGNITMKLDEAKVDLYGEKVLDEEENPVDRVAGNEYKLIPGHTYTKDPKVTVARGSEPCYVRMLVTVTDYKDLCKVLGGENGEHIVDGVFLLQDFVGGWDNTVWTFVTCVVDADNSTATYEFRYYEIVDAREGARGLKPLFETITISSDVANESLAELGELQIDVVAHAIQSDGFETVAAAWAAFDAEN